ncbi:lysosomal amino acid transporter 1 [Anaeramoeba flamelloides]|uniref:Lysosomal amino acid transporter 1 n=1 Tax=Anaeramoeba flamelloides TaxID=1746091 RepID=A0ABQ8YAN9_9EUKA|nr:lysosomal amino acid transporter 1 [Anaeramoeba flamelloides]
MQILFSCTPEYKDGRQYSKWINQLFDDCIWNTKDYVSFFVGLSSILCWLIAQLPQIILNYKTKHAGSLSFYFLSEWLVGDIANLIGCFLTDQLPTQTTTALYFVFIDSILFFQYVWYEKRKKKESKDEKKDKPLVNIQTICDLDIKNTDIELDQTPNNEPEEPLSGTGVPMNSILAIIGFGSITYLGITALVNNYSSPTSFGSTQRNILATSDVAKAWAGKIFGWISGVLYFISRIPQIMKNFKRKNTEGLSLQMFIAAIFGNVTYSLGIFTRSVEWTFLKPKLPWLIGSLGTCMFDITILSQFTFYTKLAKKRAKKKDQKIFTK